MDLAGAVVAILVGCLQGVLEWLPVSSEGSIAVALTFADVDPDAAVRFALFVHAGTGVSALAYYRREYEAAIRAVPEWRPSSAFEGRTTELSYLVLATIASGVAGLAAFFVLEAAVTALTGGAFVALIGLLLVGTGLLQRVSDRSASAESLREDPDGVDALLVGGLQGIAVLPGVSRSGVTASALLLRGHDGQSAFRYSFLLSVPAAFGAGVLVVLESGGLPAVSTPAAAIALLVSAVVGYLTIDAMMRLLERVVFWKVCVAFGALAILGGGLLVVV